MKKAITCALIALLILLAACSNKQLNAKPLQSSPTGEVTGYRQPVQQAPAPAVEPKKTAAEALKELQTQIQQPSSNVRAKSGTSPFFSPVNATAKTKTEARKLLLSRTRSAFKTGKEVSEPVKAISTFGPRYHSKSGSSINLPKEYDAGQ